MFNKAWFFGGAIFLLFALVGCFFSAKEQYLGYVEGDWVLVSSSSPGVVLQIFVQRGSTVEKGEMLFELDHSYEKKQMAVLLAKIFAIEASIENLALPARPEEVAQIDQQLAQLGEQLKQAEFDLMQQRELFKQGYSSKREVLVLETQYNQLQQQIKGTKLKRELSLQGSRVYVLEEAKRQKKVLQAELEQLRYAASLKKIRAPAAGKIGELYGVVGEYFKIGQPLLSLLPEKKYNIVFYVPQKKIADFSVGKRVKFAVDSFDRHFQAKVLRIAEQPEYTPPMIFSEQAREKLVYEVVARPEQAAQDKLVIGQPIDVMQIHEN